MFGLKQPFFGREVLNVPHVTWLDNYSHQLRVSVPTAGSTLWRDTNWSAKAAIKYTPLEQYSAVFLKHAFDGMPSVEAIFSDAVVSRFDKEYSKGDLVFKCYETSLSKSCRTLPIKVDNAETKAADRERKFIPIGILRPNIGSNTGLLTLLMQWRAETQFRRHVPVLLVDVNIYWRVMKVILFSILSQEHFPRNLVLSLQLIPALDLPDIFFCFLLSSCINPAAHSFGSKPWCIWGSGMSIRWRRRVFGDSSEPTFLLLYFTNSFQIVDFLLLLASFSPPAFSHS